MQADVAERLCVCEATVTGWEVRDIVPAVGLIPAITEMIGYLPVHIDTATLAGRIKSYRFKHGLTPEQFGELIPAHQTTVIDWEKGKHVPPKRTQRKIESILSEKRSMA